MTYRGASIFSTQYDTTTTSFNKACLLKFGPVQNQPDIASAGFLSYWYNLGSVRPSTAIASTNVCGIIGCKQNAVGNSQSMAVAVYHTFDSAGAMWLNIILGDVSRQFSYYAKSSTPIPNNSNWNHISIIWNAGGGAKNLPNNVMKVYGSAPPQVCPGLPYPKVSYAVNRLTEVEMVPDAARLHIAGGFSIDYNGTNEWEIGCLNSLSTIGSNRGGAFVGSLAEIFLYIGDYWPTHQTFGSNTNASFLSPFGNYAANLGPGGIFPFGVVPSIYLSGAPSTFRGNVCGQFAQSGVANQTLTIQPSTSTPFILGDSIQAS